MIESTPWDCRVFFFLSLLHFFPYTARLPRRVRVCGDGPARPWRGSCASMERVLERVLRVYLAGLLTIDFDHTHSSGRILGLW